MTLSIRIALVASCAILLTSTAAADDFDRRGWFVGAGGGVGWDFLEDAIQDRTMGLIEIGLGGSFNARGGYRVFSWLAFEGMYEGMYGLETKALGDIPIGEHSFHSVLANAKFIVPTWRLQPYFILGVGAQYGDFDGKGIFDPLDTNRWDFVLRPGVGLDSYVTKNWVVNLELGIPVRFADYSNIPSETTDNVTLTFSGGIQYRF